MAFLTQTKNQLNINRKWFKQIEVFYNQLKEDILTFDLFKLHKNENK